MANMSYCRFENTAGDLSDCAAHIRDELSGSERTARQQIVHLCCDILEELGFSVEVNDDWESECDGAD